MSLFPENQSEIFEEIKFAGLSSIEKAGETAIIIPCYNDAKGLLNVLNGIFKNGLPEKKLYTSFKEVIVVNDGSTVPIEPLVKYFLSHNAIIYIEHKKNMGKGQAIKTAFEYLVSQKNQVRQALLIDADIKRVADQKLLKIVKKSHTRPHSIFCFWSLYLLLTPGQILWRRWNGTRIMSMKFIKKCLEYAEFNESLGYGVEAFFNQVAKENGLKLEYFLIYGLVPESKLQKSGVVKGVQDQLRMYREIHEKNKELKHKIRKPEEDDD